MKKLILIRHCETDYTLQQKYCGHVNIPLNARGIEQAKCLRKKLKNKKIDKIYSSDLKRAFQTAKIAFPNRIISKRSALREIDFGQFSSLTSEELIETYPNAYKLWVNDPINEKMPNGESLADFAKRVENCFSKICKQNPDKTVALVSHGGPIRIILSKILNKSLNDLLGIAQDVAAINIIKFRNGMPKILKINETSFIST